MIIVFRQPQGQDCFESFGTGEISCQPYLLEGLNNGIFIVNNRFAPLLWLRFRKTLITSKSPDRVLPVITTDGATFIDDNSLFFTRCFFVAFNPQLRTGLLMEETHSVIAKRRSEAVAI
jgi:hypothetical protein